MCFFNNVKNFFSKNVINDVDNNKNNADEKIKFLSNLDILSPLNVIGLNLIIRILYLLFC